MLKLSMTQNFSCMGQAGHYMMFGKLDNLQFKQITVDWTEI